MPNVTPHPRELIGLPTIAELLGCTRPTARSYALEQRFQTWEIDGRLFARRRDVLALKARRERERQRAPIAQPA